jgi:hypothetical protein
LPRSANELIVVLDDSASMRAALPAGEPRQRGLQAIGEAMTRHGFRSLRVILAGTEPEWLPFLIRDSGALSRLSGAWQAGAPAADLEGAVAKALTFSAASRILVVTDHAPDTPPTGDRIRWLAFGDKTDNVGIIHAGRAGAGSRDRGFVTVANYSSQPVETELRLTGHTPQRLKLNTNAMERVDFWIPSPADDVEAAVGADRLEIDNRIRLKSVSQPRVRVLPLIQSPSLRALFSQAMLATDRFEPVDNPARADMVLSDQELPPLPVDTWGVRVLVPAGGNAYTGPFAQDPRHPLNEGVDWSGVIWGAGTNETSAGVPVVAAGNIPLISVQERGRAAPEITFQLLPTLSNLQTQPAWPALLWNLLNWRGQSLPGIRDPNARVGVPVQVGAPLHVATLTVRRPDHSVVQLKRGRTGFAVPTSMMGTYEIETPEAKGVFVANFLAPDESDLRGGAAGEWGGWTSAAALQERYWGVRWPLLLLALLLLCGHWILMIRGNHDVA